METALVIMAAGIGARYGGGIKQLESVGPSGEIIMDYSIYDAIESGFNKIIFVIRHGIEAPFKEIIGSRIEQACAKRGVSVCYAFQELEDLPEGFVIPEGRKKPWGTGHAVLAAKDLIKEPFAVINADDYYGKKAFSMIHSFLCEENGPGHYCMAGFILGNTLSDHGAVTRGICRVRPDGYLRDVIETHGVSKVFENGEFKAKNDERYLDVRSLVSMNMWGLTPDFLDILESGFSNFLKVDVPASPQRAEYLLPDIIAKLLVERRITVKVLKTDDNWFGVTYKEDKESVVNSFRGLINEGIYCEKLFD